MEKESFGLDHPSPLGQLALWMLLALLVVSAAGFGIYSVTPREAPAELSATTAAKLDRVWQVLGASRAQRAAELTGEESRLREARILLDEAEAEAPGHFKTLFYRGLERLASGDPASARPVLERAVEVSEPAERLPALLTLSAVLVEGKDYEAADAAVRQALELAPRSLAAWANLGQVRWLLGDKEGSIEAYRKKMELEGIPVRESGPI